MTDNDGGGDATSPGDDRSGGDDGSPEPDDGGGTADQADDGSAPDDGGDSAGAHASDGGGPSDDPSPSGSPDAGETPPPGDPDESFEPASEAQVTALEAELREFRDDVESRTLHRESVEDDLRDYVRRRIRRGHARGWGPYVVLLYGTVMTVGGFYYLSGLWAVLAMVVIWLSTLGLYVFMLVVGIGLEVTGLPRRAIERVRNR